MSQNPFSAHSHDSFQPQGVPQGPQRTSGLAIAALVCSMIVCIPGLGLIGLILGIVAMLVIKGSEGRVRGKGLAAGAVILGLIVSGVQIVGGVAMIGSVRGMLTHVQEPTYAAFKKLDAGDVSEFRALMAPNLAAGITDAEILAFRDACKSSFGDFQGQPTDLKSTFAMAGVLSDGLIMARLQQAATVKGVIPMPASYSKAPVAIVVASDAIKGQFDFAFATPAFAGTVVDVAVGSAGLPTIYLTDFIGKKPTLAPDAKPPPAPAGNGG